MALLLAHWPVGAIARLTRAALNNLRELFILVRAQDFAGFWAVGANPVVAPAQCCGSGDIFVAMNAGHEIRPVHLVLGFGPLLCEPGVVVIRNSNKMLDQFNRYQNWIAVGAKPNALLGNNPVVLVWRVIWVVSVFV